jgi:hypothetical protein
MLEIFLDLYQKPHQMYQIQLIGTHFVIQTHQNRLLQYEPIIEFLPDPNPSPVLELKGFVDPKPDVFELNPKPPCVFVLPKPKEESPNPDEVVFPKPMLLEVLPNEKLWPNPLVFEPKGELLNVVVDENGLLLKLCEPNIVIFISFEI